MKALQKLLVVALLALAWAPFAADAAGKKSIVVAPMTDGDKAHLKKIETYLDGIRTLQSPFLQVSSNGQQAQGMLFLSRPGKLRIDYEPPTPVVILANTSYLSYFDTELKQVTHLPIDDTPAAFLLRDHFSFTSGDVVVTDYHRGAGTTRVTLVQQGDPLAGRLTLVLAEEPMLLRKWTVVDAQGIVTDVTLLSPRFDYPVPASTFEFTLPGAPAQGN